MDNMTNQQNYFSNNNIDTLINRNRSKENELEFSNTIISFFVRVYKIVEKDVLI